MARLGKILFCSLVLVGGAATALVSARDKLPRSPEPNLTDIALFIVAGGDWLTSISALTALAVIALAGWQVLNPGATKADVARDGSKTRNRLGHKLDNAALSGVQQHGENLGEHTKTQTLLTGDIVERAEAALALDTLDPKQKARLIALADRIKAATGAPQRAAEMAALTTVRLEQSNEPAQRAAAASAEAGDLLGAARLRAQAAEASLADEQSLAASALRDAARLALPVSPSAAMGYFARVVELDSADVWSWIELGRLKINYEGLDPAYECFRTALEYAANDQDRASLHLEFGNLLYHRGEVLSSRLEYKKSVEIVDRLRTQHPGDHLYLRNSSVLNLNLGQIEEDLENLTEARLRYQNSLSELGKFREDRLSYVGWEVDFSGPLERLGNLDFKCGNLLTARLNYELSLTLRRYASRIDQNNKEVLRSISVAWNKLGDLDFALRNFWSSRIQFRKGLAIIKDLSASEPEHSEWQRDELYSHNRLAEAEEAEGNFEAAYLHVEKGLSIAERLVAQDPERARSWRELWVSNGKMGKLAEAAGDTEQALTYYTRAEEIMVDLVQRVPENPQFINDLATVRVDIARLEN